MKVTKAITTARDEYDILKASKAVNEPTEIPLVLGGHSFIAQLGNDPPASVEQREMIVASCLDHGIRWFDTTYQPERVALANTLDALGRRSEVSILAWNFFKEFSSGDPVPQAEYYRPHHIEIILEELRTAYIDCLVMISLGDPEENQRQEELLVDWQRKGYVRSLGLWISNSLLIDRYRACNPFRFAIRPFNITTGDAPAIFAACKKVGWETFATSPFVRGWELERRIASSRARVDTETRRSDIADLMLRFSLFQKDVDRVIVGMRKAEWVTRNAASVSRGPLTAGERWRLMSSAWEMSNKNRLSKIFGNTFKQLRQFLGD